MAYYLSNERNRDVVEAYRRYHQDLREPESEFPPGAFALDTSEWCQNASDHRCPHDARLDHFVISETTDAEGKRCTNIRIRLLGAYHDGHVEFFYPQVIASVLENAACARGLGDWLCDEFRISPNGHLVHEIEWAGFPNARGSRWIIEASDVEFTWIQQPISTAD